MPGSAATSQLEERHDPSRAANVWWTVAVVTIGAFMLILDLTVVNVALPRLRVALNANFPDLQWVIDAYELTLAAFLLPAGSVADRLGRRRVFTLGFLVFTAASLSCGLSPGILVLAISRAVQGVGGAILFAVGPALIGQAIQGKARAAAFGVFGAGMGLAIATGPLIGGALTSGLSWRWIFLVNIPVGVAGTVLGRLRMRESLARAPATLTGRGWRRVSRAWRASCTGSFEAATRAGPARRFSPASWLEGRCWWLSSCWRRPRSPGACWT
jgi:MFS family permease